MKEKTRDQTLIIGVDPGNSTGYSIFLDDARLTYGQMDSDEAVSEISEVLLQYHRHPDIKSVVACERYQQGQRNRFTQQATALHVISAIRTEAHRYGVAVLLQAPNDAKHLASNNLLRSLHLWLTGSDVGQKDADDVNDATRHVLLWMARNRVTLFEKLLDQHIPVSDILD